MATFAMETKLTNTMRKRIIKRFAATLLAMFMVFVVAQAADYGFKIGGVSVTSSNASNVTGSNIKARDSSKPYSVVYDAGTNTVTLTNISIIRSGKDNRAILNESNAGLTVVFNGENFLSAENSSPVRINAETTIKCAGGASGAVTKIYGDEEDRPILDGSHIASAWVEEWDGRQDLTWQFDREGTKKFGEITTKNIGQLLVFMLGDSLLSAPTINAGVTEGRCSLGGLDLEKACALAQILNADK